MVREAEIRGTPSGKIPVGEGWFVLNARDARWHERQFGALGRGTLSTALPGPNTC